MSLRTSLGAASLARDARRRRARPPRPPTGETLADSQTFTYNVIDEIVDARPRPDRGRGRQPTSPGSSSRG